MLLVLAPYFGNHMPAVKIISKLVFPWQNLRKVSRNLGKWVYLNGLIVYYLRIHPMNIITREPRRQLL